MSEIKVGRGASFDTLEVIDVKPSSIALLAVRTKDEFGEEEVLHLDTAQSSTYVRAAQGEHVGTGNNGCKDCFVAGRRTRPCQHAHCQAQAIGLQHGHNLYQNTPCDPVKVVTAISQPIHGITYWLVGLSVASALLTLIFHTVQDHARRVFPTVKQAQKGNRPSHTVNNNE